MMTMSEKLPVLKVNLSVVQHEEEEELRESRRIDSRSSAPHSFALVIRATCVDRHFPDQRRQPEEREKKINHDKGMRDPPSSLFIDRVDV